MSADYSMRFVKTHTGGGGSWGAVSRAVRDPPGSQGSHQNGGRQDGQEDQRQLHGEEEKEDPRGGGWKRGQKRHTQRTWVGV